MSSLKRFKKNDPLSHDPWPVPFTMSPHCPPITFDVSDDTFPSLRYRMRKTVKRDSERQGERKMKEAHWRDGREGEWFVQAPSSAWISRTLTASRWSGAGRRSAANSGAWWRRFVGGAWLKAAEPGFSLYEFMKSHPN